MPDLPVYSPPCMALSDYRASTLDHWRLSRVDCLRRRRPLLAMESRVVRSRRTARRVRTLRCQAAVVGGNSATGSLPNEAGMYKKTKVLWKCHHHQRFGLPLTTVIPLAEPEEAPIADKAAGGFQTKPECVRKQKFCENVIGRSRIWTVAPPHGTNGRTQVAFDPSWQPLRCAQGEAFAVRSRCRKVGILICPCVNAPHARDCHFLPASVRSTIS